MAFLSAFDDGTTQLDLFRRWPEIAVPLGKLVQQLLRDGPFSNEQAELIFAFTSGVNGCRYCYGIHKRTAEVFGIGEGLLDTLLDDIDAAAVDARMKPILRYARKLTLSPSKIVQADVDAILAAGWDDTAFHYATSICAAANYFNRILDGHGIHATPEYWKESGERLTRTAYDDLPGLGIEMNDQ